MGAGYATGTAPRGIAVDPASGYVYVSESDETVSIYSQSSPGVLTHPATAPWKISTGYTTLASPGPAGPYQMAMMFGSSRTTYVPKFAYAANYTDGTVSGFSIQAAGALTGVAGSPFPAGANPQAVAADPFSRFAYVANYTAGNISEYTIGAGALASIVGSPEAAGTHPQAVAVDPSGQFAYVADYTTATGGIYQYTITQTTGHWHP